jgi:hypothetical protein
MTLAPTFAIILASFAERIRMPQLFTLAEPIA